jgi:hypothetical protein
MAHFIVAAVKTSNPTEILFSEGVLKNMKNAVF